MKGYYVIHEKIASFLRGYILRNYPQYYQKYLFDIIKRINPDIIHTMEFQSAGYQLLEIKKKWKGNFPKWIATNWGSDIYLFRKFPEHKEKIVELLNNCDYYSCECLRDKKLALDLGFKGEIFDIIPNSGGFDFKNIDKIQKPQKTSQKKIILIKGYQNWAGRALCGINAIIKLREFLQEYTIAVYSSSEDVNIALRLLEVDYGLNVIIIPKLPHEELLKYYHSARIYIGLSISDAIPTSLLEAMAMGAFPIQSNTSCANEWISNGTNGLLVPPEDTEQIAYAIKFALLDNELVDSAANINYRIIKEKLDKEIIRPKIINTYKNVINNIKGHNYK